MKLFYPLYYIDYVFVLISSKVEYFFFHLPSSPVRISVFPSRNERATGERKRKKREIFNPFAIFSAGIFNKTRS